MLTRLSKFLKHKNLSFNKFEIALGVSHGSVSNALKRNKNIGSNVVEKILKTYPEISAEWLLRGEGTMLINSQKPFLGENSQTMELSNEDLIQQTLEYLQLNTKAELQHVLNESKYENTNNSLEQKILSTWDKKYGQELKIIKHQLMTLFVDKLNLEQGSKKDIHGSKVS